VRQRTGWRPSLTLDPLDETRATALHSDLNEAGLPESAIDACLTLVENVLSFQPPTNAEVRATIDNIRSGAAVFLRRLTDADEWSVDLFDEAAHRLGERELFVRMKQDLRKVQAVSDAVKRLPQAAANRRRTDQEMQLASKLAAIFEQHELPFDAKTKGERGAVRVLSILLHEIGGSSRRAAFFIRAVLRRKEAS
jgi:hypothetical protein